MSWLTLYVTQHFGLITFWRSCLPMTFTLHRFQVLTFPPLNILCILESSPFCCLAVLRLSDTNNTCYTKVTVTITCLTITERTRSSIMTIKTTMAPSHTPRSLLYIIYHNHSLSHTLPSAAPPSTARQRPGKDKTVSEASSRHEWQCHKTVTCWPIDGAKFSRNFIWNAENR